jgi:recombination protein RecA
VAPKKKQPDSVTHQLIASLHKQWGDESCMTLGGGECRSDVRVVIPSGIDIVDGYILGIGGWPGGRMVEVFSEESGGKTTLGLSAIAQVQRMGGAAVFIDAEHALDTRRAAALGVDLDATVLSQPDTLEEMLGQVETVLDTIPAETPGIIVWDSVAAMMTAQEWEAGASGDAGRMLQVPAMLSNRLRAIMAKLTRTRVCLIAINQTRTKPGVTFGNPETTPGGNALKFYASMRVRILGGAKVKSKGDGGEILGKDITIECVKNKLAQPFNKCRARLLFDGGWDNAWSTIGLAKDLEIVPDGLKGKDARRIALEALNKLPKFGTLRKPALPEVVVATAKPDADPAEGA